MSEYTGTDRWGNNRNWSYCGDRDVANGGRFFDVAEAQDIERPADSSDQAEMLRWATCGVDYLDAVEVSAASDMDSEMQDGIMIESGTVNMPQTLAGLMQALKTFGWQLDDLEADPVTRLAMVADAVKCHNGMEVDQVTKYKIGRDYEMSSRGFQAEYRIKDSFDLDEFIRRNWLSMGEQVQEDEWREHGIVVHEADEIELQYYYDVAKVFRYAYDLHKGELIAAEFKGPDHPEWTACDKDMSVVLRVAIAYPYNSKEDVLANPEAHGAYKVEEFAGFDGAPKMRLG